MKKVFYFVLTLMVLFLPNFVYAYQEYPPYINMKNQDNYDIQKIIDGNKVIVRLKKKGEKTYYSWTFNKDEVGDTIDLDFTIDLDSKNKSQIDKLAGSMDKTYISFTHHGNLPSRATITIYVGDRYKDGSKLYLYYFNEETKEIEYVDKNLKVSEGYVEFNIEHCSEYFLTTTVVNNVSNLDDESKKTMNYVIVGMISIIVVLIGITIYSARK